MREAIRRRARELGFEACRFTTAAAPQSAPAFGQWLAREHHGQMAWLQRTAHKRVDPQLVLPGARTVITLATSYAPQAGALPLTPALSPPACPDPIGDGERQNSLQPVDESQRVGTFENRALPRPLPVRRGEGRGEGQEVAHPGTTPTADGERPERRLQPALDVQCSPGHKGVQVRAKPAEAGAPGAVSGCAYGVVARYARYADYHRVLGERLRQLAGFVSQLGGQGARSLWYVDTGPLLERDLAQRAGLGFIGKHTNLISRQLGNWVLLSELITTVELQPDAPEHNRCGSCARCIAACPTGAIRAPFQLDARLCISYLTIELKGPIPVELRPAIGNRIYGCDDCLAVCPWNRFARQGRLLSARARPDLAAPDLLELLALDEAGFRRRFAGTPILRTRRSGVLRNVCVALGNTAGPAALPALERAAADPETLIAEHARWACEQIRK